MDAQPQKQSYKLIWIAGASFVVLAIIIGLVVAFIPQSNNEDQATNKAETAKPTELATKSQVEEKLDKLDADIKQAAKDQAAAKAALEKKQVKVGN